MGSWAPRQPPAAMAKQAILGKTWLLGDCGHLQLNL